MALKIKKYLPYFSGIMMALIFGHTFLFGKMSLESHTPMMLLAYRFGLAAICMLILKFMKVIKLDYTGKPYKPLVILSIFYPIIAFVFEMRGLQMITSSQAGIMVSLNPIVVMILGSFLLNEKPTQAQFICILLSIIGVFIILFFGGSFNLSSNAFGSLLILLSVTSGAVQNVLSRKYSKIFSSIEITFGMVILSAIFFNIVAIAEGFINDNLIESYVRAFSSFSGFFSLFYLGVVASVMGFFSMNYTLSKLPAFNAAAFANLATIISVIAGVYWAKETLYCYQVVGGIFIITGVWGTNYFQKN